MSYTRRAKREALHQQKKMMLKVHRQFMDRIKGKSTEEVKAIMEQIKLKYNLTDAKPQEQPEAPNELNEVYKPSSMYVNS